MLKQSELFQDDLFPPTRVTWIPTLSAADWFACRDKKVAKISLQPEGMECRMYSFFVHLKSVEIQEILIEILILCVLQYHQHCQ